MIFFEWQVGDNAACIFISIMNNVFVLFYRIKLTNSFAKYNQIKN